MEEDFISKEDFIKYFKSKNIINKKDYLLYKKTKKAIKYYHFFITLVQNRLATFRNVFDKKC